MMKGRCNWCSKEGVIFYEPILQNFKDVKMNIAIGELNDSIIRNTLIPISQNLFACVQCANKYRLKQISDVNTTTEYWDCECDKNYIHSKKDANCSICGAVAEEQPDSRIDEVLAQGFTLGTNIKWEDVVGKKVVLLNKQADDVKNWFEVRGTVEMMLSKSIARVIWEENSGMRVGFISTNDTSKYELLRLAEN